MPRGDGGAYDRHREKQAKRQRLISESGREIGPLPEIVDPQRRESSRLNFRLFCETYFADVFCARWSEDQLAAIARIERCVLQGGLFALAMPRGNGKSSLCESAVLWAVLYGHHRYVFLINATDDKFSESLESIQCALEANELLAEDFPEVCHPIACLEGIAQRARGQTLNGQLTSMKWSGKRRRLLPTVEGSVSSAAMIGGGGLKAGTIRGSKFRTRDGRIHRPSLVILDDPQTDESADSIPQSDKRERLVSGAVIGMAGPGEKIAVIMPCTVIQRGDMADRMLDREKHPEWRGLRTAMITSWPERMDLWEQWDELRRKVLKTDADLESNDEDPAPEATEFVRQHFADMHRGGTVSWESRKRPWHLSGLHQAMEFYFRDPLGFFSEYQQWLMTPGSPADPTITEDLHLDAATLRDKLSGYPRRALPPETQWVVGFVDCHDRVLYWMLVALGTDFSGAVIDYGTWPQTERLTFYAGSFRPTLKERYPGTGQDGALTAGLDDLWDWLLTQPLKRTDGVAMSPQLILTDAGYMGSTVRKTVEARRDNRLMPSLGRVVGPNDLPFSQWRQRVGERLGEDWLIRKPIKTSLRTQHVLIDTYSWKTNAARRLLTAPGDPGSISLFGTREGRIRHDFLGRHLSSEIAKPVTGRAKVNVWEMRPGESENHWWDCFVGCCVAGSILGAKLGGVPDKPAATVSSRPKTRVSLTLPDGRAFFVTNR